MNELFASASASLQIKVLPHRAIHCTSSAYQMVVTHSGRFFCFEDKPLDVAGTRTIVGYYSNRGLLYMLYTNFRNRYWPKALQRAKVMMSQTLDSLRTP